MAKRVSVGRIQALVKQMVSDMVVSSNVVPKSNAGADLGSPNFRFNNVYVSDLHMQNERGHYTLIEEEEYLSIRNNKTGKLYKFVLEEIEDYADPSAEEDE